MDVVYRYKASGGGEELRISLRSLQNVPHDNVWIVGDIPHWFNNGGTIHVPQRHGNKWNNSRVNVLEACKNPEISDQFILMDDDFFILEPIEEIPVWHRGSIESVIQKYRKKYPNSKYFAGLIETHEMLKTLDISQPLYAYNLHIPMVVDKEKMLESVKRLDGMKPKTVPQCFHLRSWYGNYNELGGVKMEDVKIRDYHSPMPDGPFLSTQNSAFTGHTKRLLKQKFPAASIYERRGTNAANNRRRPRSGPR